MYNFSTTLYLVIYHVDIQIDISMNLVDSQRILFLHPNIQLCACLYMQSMYMQLTMFPNYINYENHNTMIFHNPTHTHTYIIVNKSSKCISLFKYCMEHTHTHTYIIFNSTIQANPHK